MSNNDQIQVTSSLNPGAQHGTVTRNNFLWNKWNNFIWQVTTLTSWGLSSLCVSWTKFGVTPRCHLVLIGLFPSANTVLILKKCRCLFISLQCKGHPSDHVDVQSNLSDLGHGQQCLRDKAAFCLSPCRRSIAQQCIPMFFRQLRALIATRITGGRHESH